MDPDLPFFYHTSKHSHFYEGLMPDFSVTPAKKRKPKRLPRYELLGENDRISFSVRGDSSIRAKFHNMPSSTPPGTLNPSTHEQSYAMATQTIKKNLKILTMQNYNLKGITGCMRTEYSQ